MKGPDCNLPPLPGKIAPAVGFPESGGIAISKTDFALMAEYIMLMRGWIDAASACLEANQ